MTSTVVGGQPKVRNDPLSDCRSLGSTCHPSSQSRKISIGVMVESPTNGKSRGTKEQKSSVPSAEVPFPILKNSMQWNRKNNDAGTVDPERRSKLSEAPQQVSSPWISTRFLDRIAPVTGTISEAEGVFHFPNSRGGQNKVDTVNVSPTTYSSGLFKSRRSRKREEKDVDKLRHRMEGGKVEAVENLHEFAFATTEEVLSDKAVREDEANQSVNRTETLKMKLREILGTVSLPDEPDPKGQNPKNDVNQLITEPICGQKHDTAGRVRQNSDTIETDSEDPNQASRTPIIHSLTRKRPRTLLQSSKYGTSSCDKMKRRDGSSFTLEGWPGGTHVAIKGASSNVTRKMSEKRGFEFQPRKISFPVKHDKTETSSKPAGIKTLAPGEKPSSLSGALEFLSYPDKESLGTAEKNEKRQFIQSPQRNKKEVPRDFNSPVEFAQHEDVGNSFFKKDVDPSSNVESPTFRMKTPVCSSPSSTSETGKMENDFSSPSPAEKIFVMREIFTFRDFQTPEKYYNASNARLHFSVSLDDDREIQQSPPRKPGIWLTERAAHSGLSDSSSEDTSSIEASSQRDTSSPKVGAIKRLKAMLHPVKMTGWRESHEFNCFRLGESSCTEETLLQNQEDGLARAVKLFLSELEKLKSKIISVSIEKSSEILLSITDSIQLQLQNVESQVQMDMVKLCSLGRSRRKILETKLAEQQEQFKSIHKKFKDEVNEHLQACKSSLEELEAQQTEFKGIIEKKKASNRSTLLQVEESVDMQLTDAQKRIEAIHEVGRGKMLQLKQVIALCLK